MALEDNPTDDVQPTKEEHILTQEEIEAATFMQPRIQDFQESCRDCGETWCRRCDGPKDSCPKCKRGNIHLIPIPCAVLVRFVMAKGE